MTPEAGASLWRAAVAKVLKGGDAAMLAGRSPDGLPIEPLYAKAEPAGPGPWRTPASPFRIVQRIDHLSLDAANLQARDDAAGGAGGLTLVGAGAPSARGFGLPLRGASDIAAVLDGIAPGTVSLRLDLPAMDGAALVDHLIGWWVRQDAPETLDIDIGLDPLGAPDQLRRVAVAARALNPAAAILRADGRPHHEAGASQAQELGAVVAAGVAGLRALEDLGLEAARDALSFTLAAEPELILTIAKLRALRRLWACVEDGCGLVPKPIRLHAETAWRVLARDDSHTNLMRNAVAAAAAILGGADSLTVLPFTSAIGLPDPAARRLARNTPLVLIAESGLDRVADPAAGAGSVETLTTALCRQAWRLFQDIERGGGLAAMLAAGTWQASLAATRHQRQADLLEGRAIMVGVTAFPPPAAQPPAVLAPTRGDIAPVPGALPSRREAAAFEAAP